MPKAKPGYMRNFLTPADAFYEVTRSKPYLLSSDEQALQGLTPATWQLEIVPDEPPWQPVLKRTCRKADGSAFSYKELEGLFSARPIRCIKLMQCLLDFPNNGFCSNGLWEGVALRDVLVRLGRLVKVRRLFYTGWFEKPQQRFASSLSLSEVLETPPGHIPVFLALRLNGRPLPIERGGPVRMIVPESYGFKSIKWLNRIVLTNDFRANDTYATESGDKPYAPDPCSPMKTLARLDVHASQKYPTGKSITMQGMASVGASGLQRVEYWLRPDQGTHGHLDSDDSAWVKAEWKPAVLVTGIPRGWSNELSGNAIPDDLMFFERGQNSPRIWPLPFSWVPWSVRLDPLAPGAYEFRVRAVDLNGYAQPEPRPNPQSGVAEVPCQTFVVG
jgi:DMSO/TMAO reductase YedYZ molybdopterin-dependent catalytic subunit